MASKSRTRKQSTDRRDAHRHAVTMIELLVVIAIISLLAAITVPAIQAARQAARGVQCQNRHRQVALAVQGHIAALRFLPTNGGFDEELHDRHARLKFVPSTTDYSLGRRFQWGMAIPGLPPAEQTGSWAYAVLPYLGSQAAYSKVDHGAVVEMYRCAARGRDLVSVPQDDEYGEYKGGGLAWAKTDVVANALLMLERPHAIPPSSIADGLSNTLLTGEKPIDFGVQQETCWYWDEPYSLGGSKGTVRLGVEIVRDGYRISFKENWGAPHGDRMTYSRADGSVAMLSRLVDPLVFNQMLVPDGP